MERNRPVGGSERPRIAVPDRPGVKRGQKSTSEGATRPPGPGAQLPPQTGWSGGKLGPPGRRGALAASRGRRGCRGALAAAGGAGAAGGVPGPPGGCRGRREAPCGRGSGGSAAAAGRSGGSFEPTFDRTFELSKPHGAFPAKEHRAGSPASPADRVLRTLKLHPARRRSGGRNPQRLGSGDCRPQHAAIVQGSL